MNKNALNDQSYKTNKMILMMTIFFMTSEGLPVIGSYILENFILSKLIYEESMTDIVLVLLKIYIGSLIYFQITTWTFTICFLESSYNEWNFSCFRMFCNVLTV